MPRRDAAQPPQEAGTALIKGRVVALDTGAPLRHVQLRLMGEKLKQPRGTLTDAQGQYEFKDLNAGRYTLMASKGGFVTLQYGQRGPKESGRAIELADKQALDKINVALPRGAVITGRVVDEAGEPVADMTVLALQYRVIQGKRRLMSSGGMRGSGTNDIGQYRIYGLPPGEYYVSVSGRSNGGMGGMDIQNDETASGYAPTYYPGTPSVAEAQKVTVGVGEEAAADIQLTPTRVARVAGSVITSAGKPPTSGMVMLRPRGGEVFGGGMAGNGGPLRPDGTFSINGVPAGSYQMMVMANLTSEDFSPSNMETGSQLITVAGQDLTDMRLATTKGITLSGHITYEGGTPDTTVARQMRPGCFPADMESMMFTGMPSAPDEQGQFEIKNLSAPCFINIFGTPGWTLKSVMLNGVDVTERPIEPAGRPIAGVEVTMTNRVTTLTGTVQSGQDQQAKEYTVVVFPEDSQRWQPPLAQRYIRKARPDQTGTFKLTGVPAGRYYVAAFDNIEDGGEMDPEFLTRIQSLATRTELSEGGTQTLSLKMNENRQP